MDARTGADVRLLRDRTRARRTIAARSRRGGSISEPAKILRFPTERTKPRRLVDLAELQEWFGFSTRWWRYRIAEGLPAHRWCGGLRFDPDEVRDWLDSDTMPLKRRRDARTSGAMAKPTEEV
jgi:hypothetical protein